MKTSLLYCAVALALTLLTGCPAPENNECKIDRDCFLGESCQAGECLESVIVCGEDTIACPEGCCSAPSLPSHEVAFISDAFSPHGALAVDDSGMPHIITTRDDEGLLLLTWGGSSWQSTTPALSKISAQNARMRASFHEGELYILFCGSSPDDGLGPALAWQQDGLWHAEIVAIVNTCPNDLWLAFDSHGTPHVIYRYMSRIERAYRDEFTRWQMTLHVQNDWLGFDTPMTIDSRDRLHIVYGTVEGLNYDILDGDTVENHFFDSGPAPDPAIALDADDRLHVIFTASKHDGLSVPQDLEYVVHDGTAWSDSVKVEDRLSVIYNATAIIDGHGRLHTAYSNGQLNNLKMSTWDGERWRGTTIDSDGDTGHNSRLVIDGWNRKHFSYFEYHGDKLRLHYRWIP
ncbi:MAG: hypothetical protein ACNA8W_10550 [Bradymonadaceae bacterium]